MEIARIEWESIDSVFIIDDSYEHIKAPKWVDFSVPLVAGDDDAWFCTPDCNHPKTVEDLKLAPKVQRSTTVSEILPTSDQSRRDANLTRRLGYVRSLLSSKKGTKRDKLVVEDGENVNPNLHTTPSNQYNEMKSVVQSSTDKKNKKENDKSSRRQKLKSTLSARNLCGGRDMVNQIAELCSELKRLGRRTIEREKLLEKEEENFGDALKKSNVMENEVVKAGSKKKVEESENTSPNSVDSNKKKKKNKNKDVAAVQNATRTPLLKPTSSSRPLR